ncbi:hypothetical protein HPC44_05530 [Komagataeibacter oboediens]|uniref:RNA-binding S4 domain-containing protein n=1 Tax=Komagataeibacter oboediens TaxID=65958 RepID=A0ABS5SS23_9PROT|nr:hypothetical protein [Komagataeibacter oboediens]MBT0676660.1 hypothetical protein [Komagataeibacter oboediens]MBT0678185.1 hypothetical protein [Komagataeibacter oboediens]
MSAQTLFRFLVAVGHAPSFGEARRLVRAGRVLVNRQRATDEGQAITVSDLVTVPASTGGTHFSADYINRIQGEIMQMISGDCASRHRQSVPARARFRAMHFWAVCLLLSGGAALLLHAMGRRSSRKSR